MLRRKPQKEGKKAKGGKSLHCRSVFSGERAAVPRDQVKWEEETAHATGEQLPVMSVHWTL